MQEITDYPFDVEEIENIFIPLSDGIKLSAKVWRPANCTNIPCPVVTEMIPYRKRLAKVPRDGLIGPYLAGHGFAFVRIDIRGSGESDGIMLDEYLEQEIDDAVEAIDWLSKQSWSNGNVGMTGISWGGFNSLQTAARRPEALKAIITVCASDDRYADDVHYQGGCQILENPLWSTVCLAMNALPPDPQIVGDNWRDMWEERLDILKPWSHEWIAHQRRDDYWKHSSVCEDFSQIDCAVLSVGGWEDSYSNAIPRQLAGLSCPRQGIIGPWTHLFPFAGTPGPNIGYLQECIRWWDYWLKGEDTGIMDEPMLRAWINDSDTPKPYYDSHPGHWVSEPSWPSDNIKSLSFHINARGLSETADKSVTKSLCSPQWAGSYSGRQGGYGGTSPDMALDQRLEDAMGLSFDSQPLTEDLVILGMPIARLKISSDKPAANIAVRLCDVAPDGTSALITYGVFNLTHRNSHEFPEALVPGAAYVVDIPLNDIGRTVPAGHSIRLAVASNHWPVIWPHPENATLSITCGESSLILPTRVPRLVDATRPTFLTPEGAKPTPMITLREGSDSHVVSDDKGRQIRSIVNINDAGGLRYSNIGVDHDSYMEERYFIHYNDPLSARVEADAITKMKTGDVDVEIAVHTSMTADENTYFLNDRVKITEKGKEAREFIFENEIPRDFT